MIVFVNSIFWHGHPTKFKLPKSNQAYWESKIERNRERDKFVNKTLRDQGWKVIRFWEHEIKKNLDQCVQEILRELELIDALT